MAEMEIKQIESNEEFECKVCLNKSTERCTYGKEEMCLDCAIELSDKDSYDEYLRMESIKSLEEEG